MKTFLFWFCVIGNSVFAVSDEHLWAKLVSCFFIAWSSYRYGTGEWLT